MGSTPSVVGFTQHNGKIDYRIAAEIRRSDLLMANLSSHRGGVYFEAGIALGPGIPLVWTCRESVVMSGAPSGRG